MSASGKTFLADELAEILRGMKRTVIRAGLDGFHNPPRIRKRQGSMSVEGYVEDSFDYASVREKVLIPLGPEGNLQFQKEIFDQRKEQRRKTDLSRASAKSILVFEGVMLFNRELVDLFDYRILVDCSEQEILKRARIRDLEHFKSLEILEPKYARRFLPGQRIHMVQNRPQERAHAILQNDELENPILQFKSIRH